MPSGGRVAHERQEDVEETPTQTCWHLSSLKATERPLSCLTWLLKSALQSYRLLSDTTEYQESGLYLLLCDKNSIFCISFHCTCPQYQ